MITYRPATTEDAPGVSALSLEASRDHYMLAPEIFAPPPADRPAPGPNLREPKPDSLVLIAQAEATTVGFIHAECLREEREFLQPSKYLRISIVAVLQSHRGRGVGTELMARAEQWGLSQGCTQARLNVWAVNSRAAELYRERGYVAMSTTMSKTLEHGT